MKNEKPVTFACFVGNRLIEKVWFVRHVTASVQHMAESFIKNYRQLVFALDVAKTCYMVMKKAVSSVGQNQLKPRQRNVLLMSKNTTNDKKYGEKHDTKKTRKMAYAHAAVKGKQTRDIVLARFAEKQ
jgi:hypothetical protein